MNSEWAVNMHRDTYASHIGHEDMLYFVSVAENESVERVRYTMLEVGWISYSLMYIEDAPTLWPSTHQTQIILTICPIVFCFVCFLCI